MEKNQATIKNKLLISIFAGLLLIISLLTSFAYFTTDYHLKKELTKQVDTNLKGISTIFEDYKSHALGHATNLATNQAILHGVTEKDHQSLFEVTASLMENGHLDYLVLTDNTGDVIIRTHVPNIIPHDNIAYQENITMALQGTPYVGIEQGRVVRLSIRAGVPIIDPTSTEIVGVISTGYVISENTIVDMAKDIFNSEFSLYFNTERVASTITNEHEQRFIGGILEDELIYQNVLQEGKVEIKQENLFGSSYMAGYAPLYNNNNEIIGIISTSVPFSLIAELKSTLLTISLILSIFIISGASISAYGFIQKYNATEKQRGHYEEDIRNREQHLRQITRAIGEGLYVVDKAGNLTFMNPEAERLLQWKEEELIGKDIHEMIHYQKTDGTPVPKCDCKVLTTINSGKSYRIEDDTFIRKDGTFFPVSFVSAPLTSNGEIIGSVAVFQDITERKIVQDQLHKQAHYDQITNFPNRALFEKLFNETIEEKEWAANTHALLFIDIDRFKLINDTYGHNFGDLLLHAFGKRVQETIGKEHVIARFGGDEFIILLRNVTDEAHVQEIANTIIQSMKFPLPLNDQKLVVTCSIGISLYPHHGKELTELLKKADLAIIRAKQNGRNLFKIYSSDVDAQNSERLALESDLSKAMDQDEFMLHYQPIVDPSTNTIVSMEALLRWNHPERGLIPPSVFIPIAEENGVIIRLTEWVLFTACQQTKAWQDKGYVNLKISVNISAVHFHHPCFVDMVIRILNETDLEPQYLNLEITESVCIYNVETVITILEKLKSLGIGLFIDDFGTGYSSLTYLRQIPFNLLKIDRSFIQNINEAKQDTIASTMIFMAHKLGMKVVAEGVETDEQRSYLIQHGCNFMQGYLFSKPLPAKEIEQKLDSMLNKCIL